MREIAARDLEGVDAEAVEHVDGVERERRGDEAEAEAAGTLRDREVRRFVELVAREQVARARTR